MEINRAEVVSASPAPDRHAAHPYLARRLFAAACGKEDLSGFRGLLPEPSTMRLVNGRVVVELGDGTIKTPDDVLPGSSELFRPPVYVSCLDLGVVLTERTSRLQIRFESEAEDLVQMAIRIEDSEEQCVAAAQRLLRPHIGYHATRVQFSKCRESGEALMEFREGWTIRAVSISRLLSGLSGHFPSTAGQTWGTVFYDDSGLGTGSFAIADRGILDAFDRGEYHPFSFDEEIRKYALKHLPDMDASEARHLFCNGVLDVVYPSFCMEPGDYSSEWIVDPQFLKELDILMQHPGSVKVPSDALFVGRVLYMAHACLTTNPARSTPFTASAAFLFSCRL
jgi:hypothetical protein